jgi:hypothetical protein
MKLSLKEWGRGRCKRQTMIWKKNIRGMYGRTGNG